MNPLRRELLHEDVLKLLDGGVLHLFDAECVQKRPKDEQLSFARKLMGCDHIAPMADCWIIAKIANKPTYHSGRD